MHRTSSIYVMEVDNENPTYKIVPDEDIIS